MSSGSLSRSSGRKRSETLFRLVGLGALSFAAGTLLLLVAGVVSLGTSAFWHHGVTVTVSLDPAVIGVGTDASAAERRTADYRSAVRNALTDFFPDIREPAEIRELQALLSPGAEFDLARRLADEPDLVGAEITIFAPVSDDVEMLLKGRVAPGAAEQDRVLTNRQLEWVRTLQDKGVVSRGFNGTFLWGGDSSYPELAGVLAGVIGSLIAVGLAVLIAAPLGVATAVFLEEFAPKNRLTDLIEININNLAAVPSIIFGLLGLTVFILFFGLPRSAPLVGGLVLALMTLPTIVIATRAALRSLPRSLKEGAQALGASRLDTVLDPVLPAATPGIVTGVIIGFAQALGETAPLLLIGMVAFVATPPASALDPSSALPVLVYLWAESPERAFVEKTAGAIIVLLTLLVLLNLSAAVIRRRFDPYRR